MGQRLLYFQYRRFHAVCQGQAALFYCPSKVLFGFYRVSLLTLAIRYVIRLLVQLRIAKVNPILLLSTCST